MKEIKTIEIKTKVMNVLLGDLRILKLFGMDGYKNTSQYMGRHVYPYLNGENDSCYIGTYIYFDVIEKDDDYKIMFEIKAHKDISCYVPNNIDKIEEYIKDDLHEAFGLNSACSTSPSICRSRYIEKQMAFLLKKKHPSLYN